MVKKVLGNIRDPSQSGLMAGEEVDFLVGGLEDGNDLHWMILKTKLTGRARRLTAEDHREELVGTVLTKVGRAMQARTLLLTRSVANQRYDAVSSAPRCFTHVSVYRAWMNDIVKHEAINEYRRQSRRPKLKYGESLVELIGAMPTDDEALDELRDRVHATWSGVDELAALVEEDHRKRPGQRGWMRAQHLRHTFARLPHRRAAIIAARHPTLGIGDLPMAHSDLEMAENLTRELRALDLGKAVRLPVTVASVYSTRVSFRAFLEKEPSDLSETFQLLLHVACGEIDLRNWRGGSDQEAE